MNILIAAALAVEMLAGPYRAEVIRVIDGDTFVARIAIWPGITAQTSVRLRGIDTPELRGPDARHAQAAKVRLEQLLSRGPVFLRDIAPDKYGGRMDARVSADGADVAEILAREGFGHTR